MNLDERIRIRRKQLNLTLEDIAKVTGVTKSTVLKWENGTIKHLRVDKLENLADILGTTTNWLLGQDEEHKKYEDEGSAPGVREIPIISKEAPESEMKYIGFTEVSKTLPADFALRHTGNDMSGARIFDGDLVYFQKQDNVKNGEIAAIVVGNTIEVKRVYTYKRGIELRAADPSAPILEFDEGELDQVKIIGKAVAFLSEIK